MQSSEFSFITMLYNTDIDLCQGYCYIYFISSLLFSAISSYSASVLLLVSTSTYCRFSFCSCMKTEWSRMHYAIRYSLICYLSYLTIALYYNAFCSAGMNGSNILKRPTNSLWRLEWVSHIFALYYNLRILLLFPIRWSFLHKWVEHQTSLWHFIKRNSFRADLFHYFIGGIKSL